jgi:cytochrome c-type biogenesis protein CcmH/NrfG
MLFAPDWTRDTAHLSEAEPAPSREMFARWASDLLRRQDARAAADRAQIGTEQFPGYATGWFVLARAQFMLNEYTLAQSAVERCLALEPCFLSAWDLLATICEKRGREAAAASARLRKQELRGEEPPSSETPATPETIDRGVQRLVMVRRSAPARAFETPTLAEVYRRQGLLDRALDVYNRILERHPDDAGTRAMVEKLKTELASRHRPKETV